MERPAESDAADRRWGGRRLLVGLIATLFVSTAIQPSHAQTCGGPYTVVRGDTLSNIAGRVYGDPKRHDVLATANSGVLRNGPSHLAIGMTLNLPCLDATGQPMLGPVNTEAMRSAIAAEGVLGEADLDTLFGPVALFPDKLLTPVLVASTFPIDIVKAGRFVEDNAALGDQERAAQAANQPWDPSVRELAAGFPDVVRRMSDNIDWTEQAGEAVVAQTDDVLASIQRLRAKAQMNGYLVNNETQKVETVNDKIVIASAQPNVVYVPTYSQTVYTTPAVVPPTYYHDYHYDHYDDDYWDDILITGGIVLGGAIILDEIFDDDDWDGWDSNDDIDWDRGDINIDRGDINIDGDVNIGDGERPRIGDGERPVMGGGNRTSIGSSDRPQVDRGDLERARAQVGDGNRPNTRPVASPAQRDVARQKIESRKATGAKPAALPASRKAPTAGTAQRANQPARQVNRAAPTARSPQVSKPTMQKTPKAHSPSRSSSFNRTPNSRPAAASMRGHSSMGGAALRGGGGRGGGGGRR